MELNQYQIVLVNLDPTVGSEIKKTRQCTIISPNEMNKFLRTIVVAPMTTKSRKYPTRIEVEHDNKIGWVEIDQIRTIAKKRIINVMGILSKSEIIEIKSVLKETFID
jgi:mRNA interferase MazF